LAGCLSLESFLSFVGLLVSVDFDVLFLLVSFLAFPFLDLVVLTGDFFLPFGLGEGAGELEGEGGGEVEGPVEEEVEVVEVVVSEGEGEGKKGLSPSSLVVSIPINSTPYARHIW
jgi:hypothetical protein